MTGTDENKSSLPEPERTRHRLEIFNQLFRGLLIVGGGGIVALFAFLQAVSSRPSLVKVVLVGILLLAASMVAALLFMKYRYETSEHDQFRTGKAHSYKKKERFCLNASIGLIGVAIVELVVGVWCLL